MLDARQLQALAAVLEQGGFGAAANALNLTLAAVSLRIKGLEASLGQRLLVRGKSVPATPAGQALLAHVKQLRLFESALAHGLGWGMVPEGSLAGRAAPLKLAEILPGSAVDVALYWHHWEREPESTRHLTRAVKLAARKVLSQD